MLTTNWTDRNCSCDGYNFEWSAPRYDATKGRYRSLLRECSFSHGKDSKDRFQREVSLKKSEYSVQKFRDKIICEVLHAVHRFENEKGKSPILGDYIFRKSTWDDVRKFFGWSTNTAACYQSTLHNVFNPILLMPVEKIGTEDIENAINAKCNQNFKYKASTIRAWYKIINRIFVYLEVASPTRIHNPVRMNGKKICEAQQHQRNTTAEARISQKALNDEQLHRVFWTFLEDIKNRDYRGICGIMMMENGRRPIEAGATTLGMHIAPMGENFLSAPVYEVNDGEIVDKHKSGRSIRQIPDSPILEQVFTYYHQIVVREIDESSCCGVDWRTVPFGGKFVYDKNGCLKKIRPFSSREISAYVRQKLVACGITFSVTVENTDEDSDDNRRAYCLRYTALTNLFCFLSRDKYQYIAAHRRSTSDTGCEDNQNFGKYYLAPQVQRDIYAGMKKMNESIYGHDITHRIRHFLELDK